MPSLTVGDVIRRCRDQVNEQSISVGYWHDRVLFDYVYDGIVDLALEADVLVKRKTFFTTTTGTREYSLPTDVVRVLNLYFDNKLQQQVDFKEFARTTNQDNFSATAQGTPDFYYIFGSAGTSDGVIGFEPKPNKSAAVVAIYTYLPATNPSSYTTSTNLELPYEYGPMLQNYILYRAWAKEHSSEGVGNSRFYKQMWDESIVRIKRLHREKYTGDRFSVTKDVDQFFNTNFGIV